MVVLGLPQRTVRGRDRGLRRVRTDLRVGLRCLWAWARPASPFSCLCETLCGEGFVLSPR